MAEDFVGVVENVEVVHFPALTVFALHKSFLDCFGRAHVSRASRGREEENLFEHLHVSPENHLLRSRSRWACWCGGRTSRMRPVVISDEIFGDIQVSSRIDDRHSIRIDQQRNALRLRICSQGAADVPLQGIKSRHRFLLITSLRIFSLALDLYFET